MVSFDGVIATFSNILTISWRSVLLLGANLGVTKNTISLKWKNLKKMIIVRNDKEITCREAISRRRTGNALGQKKRDK
jgi:hypothetical protein